MVKVLGKKREKATLAMPIDMYDAVSDHVRKRIRYFGDDAEKL